MNKEQIKQAILSILIAGLAAFFASLASGLVELLKNNAVEATSGAIAGAIYLAKIYKA